MAQRDYNSYRQGRTIEFKQYEKQSDYVDGTAAPQRLPKEKPNKKPVKKPLTKREQRHQREMEKRYNRANYRGMNSESMSLGHALFLIAMVAVLVFMCVDYLKYEATISEKKNNINALKSNIEVITSQNDAIAYDIEAYIDLDRIIDVATGELGMVMVSSDQIKYFEKHPDEFMNQYADVPEK